MSRFLKIYLYNTLTRRKEVFRPLHKNWVGLYTCGPTVYNYAHIGNLRTYIFEDVLRRTLAYAGYKVKHVMNITDVGHLTSDADEGEDKLEKEAQQEKKSVWDIAEFYTSAFLNDILRLNIKRAGVLTPATKNIKQQIALIEKLFRTGLAYETTQAVYFNVSEFKTYTKLSRQRIDEKITAARAEVIQDPEKRNPRDFALWFKRTGKFKNHALHWPSPWGDGFPGWHIECSAISTAYLGQPFDIHTGGVDHISVHHTNEIAQSEGAFGKPMVKYWMHGEFLLLDQARMGKSVGNFITLDTLVKKGINPLAFRYLALGAHYRSKLNFTWESLSAAQNSLERLYDFVERLSGLLRRNLDSDYRGFASIVKPRKNFEKAIYDDLDTPKALSVLWNLIRDYNKKPVRYQPREVLKLLFDLDQVLGLGLKDVKSEKIPAEILQLAEKREALRKEKKWQEADHIRKKILNAGYEIKDSPQGSQIKERHN
ncbi:MAG: cysteine--tRNA ligase [Candidatus Sungbacteria bacterium]|nr:cysteine--tRNA ligase [Candidatus Sungbacteria bacterium]